MTLINPTSKAADIKSTAKRMEDLALIRMVKIEDEQKPNDQQRKMQRPKPFYIGLGCKL
jgi:hypothetical protein